MEDSSAWKSHLMSSCGPAWPGHGVVFVRSPAEKRSVPKVGAMIPSITVGDDEGGLEFTNSRVLTSLRFGDGIIVALVPGFIQPVDGMGNPASDLLAGKIAKFVADASMSTDAPHRSGIACQLFQPTGACCTLTNVRCCNS